MNETYYARLQLIELRGRVLLLGMTPEERLQVREKRAILETRANPYHDPATGRFTSGPGGGGKSLHRLDDIIIGKSLGAKARNYDVLDLQTGERYHFAEGTRIRDVTVFAGKGSRTVFRKADKFADRYGGEPSEWQHVKGKGVLDTPDGDRPAEVHWVQCAGIGKFEFFVKEWLE